MFRNIKKTVEMASPLEPTELLLPHLDFYSNKEVFVDGSMGIIEYNSETVRLNCKDIIVRFNGSGLSVKAEAMDRITVYGNILSVDFCNM